jgi:hypothetical protein
MTGMQAFLKDPWSNSHEKYKEAFFSVTPSVENATAEVLTAALHRTIGIVSLPEKQVLASGTTVVHFLNGDTKRSHSNGTVEYFYREVDTWHTTLESGVEV